MTKLMAYDYDAEKIEEIAEANDTTEAEIITMLMDYVYEMKREYGLK